VGSVLLIGLFLVAVCAVGTVIARATLRFLARQDSVVPHNAPQHPEVVITLVHGTWARNATWTRASSPLCSALRAEFPRMLIVPFTWSGANTMRARDKGSQALAAHIRDFIFRHPSARHYIIAHSHGGNIAMYALREDDLRRRFDGLVCLSTPFLHVRPREIPPVAKFALAGSALMLPLILREALSDWCCPAGPAMVDWLSVPLAIAVGIGLMNVLPASAARASRRLALPRLDSTRCLLIRAAGDEASAALGALQLMNWLTMVLWVKPAELLQAGYDSAVTWSESLARFNRHFAWTLGISIICAAVGAGTADSAPGWLASGLLKAGLVAGSLSLVFFIVRGAPGNFLLYGFFLLGVLFAPLPLLLALVLLPFGPGLAPFATLLDVSAEPTPPGSWQVHQLPTHPPHEPTPLMHSASYQLPEAISLIVSWIRERQNVEQQPTPEMATHRAGSESGATGYT
jgi:hypothetical protein